MQDSGNQKPSPVNDTETSPQLCTSCNTELSGEIYCENCGAIVASAV